MKFKEMSGDGVQPADLKRVGKAEPKVYVHKDGKTIMIPAEKKDEYMAKGYKLSSLRAESAMNDYGAYLDMEFKRQNKYKDMDDFEASPEFQALMQRHPVFKNKENEDHNSSKGMNKYGLAARNKDGKFYSYRNGKLTGTFDNMADLQKHQHDLIKDESIDQETDESGIMYKAGVKKYGKDGMKKIQSAAGKGASAEEIGKIKDQHNKNKKESVQEDLAQMAQKVEQDHEVQMARSDLYKAAKYSIKLHERLKGVSEEEGLEGWVAAKITKASDYLSSVFHYMDYEMMSSEDMTESRTKIVQAIKTKSEQPEPTYKETISKKYQTKLEEVSKKKTEAVLEDFVGKPITEEEFEKLAEKQDACYHKVKSRYKVWPSAYASGALVQCRKKGAANWGNKSKK